MPSIFCPFRTADRVLEDRRGPVFVDFHAEATSEKVALALYLDGRITALLGTHTHVQTKDARILPRGSAFLTDAGMTGPHSGVIGMSFESTLPRFLKQTPSRFSVAKGEIHLQGALIEFDAGSAKASRIETLDLRLEEES